MRIDCIPAIIKKPQFITPGLIIMRKGFKPLFLNTYQSSLLPSSAIRTNLGVNLATTATKSF